MIYPARKRIVVLTAIFAAYTAEQTILYALAKDPSQDSKPVEYSITPKNSDDELRRFIDQARALNSGEFVCLPASGFTPQQLERSGNAFKQAGQCDKAESLYCRAFTLEQEHPKMYFMDGRPVGKEKDLDMVTITYLPPLIGCLIKEGKLREAAFLEAKWEAVFKELSFPPAAGERWRLQAVTGWGNDADVERQLKDSVATCLKEQPGDLADVLRKNTAENSKKDADGIRHGMIQIPTSVDDTLTAMSELSKFYSRHGQYAKREDVLRKKAALQEKVFPPGSDTHQVWVDIAYCCDRQGKPEEAAKAIRHSIDLLKGDGFAEHDFGGCLRFSYAMYASYLKELNKPEEAEAASSHAAELEKKYR